MKKSIIILNILASLTFAIGLVFFVPAVSPKVQTPCCWGISVDRGGINCYVEIKPASKYTYISYVDLTIEYVQKSTDGKRLLKTEIRSGKPLNGKIEWELDSEEYYLYSLYDLNDIQVRINKVVCNNGADLRWGIFFLIISVISLGALLYLIFKQKREKAKG